MKYNQPFTISDPNAPYINGDLSIARAGSIPPAEAIEYPQREIVNLITDAQIVPTNSDLHQLAKGVQSGRLIYSDDTGVANQYSLAPSPAILALSKGMQFITTFTHDNTGPSVASISGLPFIEIIRPSDGASLQPLDIRAGSIGCLAYDAPRNKFQLAWSQQPLGSQVYLTTNLDYYVGGTGAADTNDGTQATFTAGTTKGPFATLQKAMNTIANFNLNGHNITVHVFSPGTYQSVSLSRVAGNGTVFWIGDPTTPANVVINGNGVSALIAKNCGPCHNFDGFRVQTSGSYTNDPMCGVNCSGTGTILALYDMDWGACSGSHCAVTQAAVLSMGKKWNITGSANGANAGMPSGWHLYVATEAIIQPDGGNLPVLTIAASTGGQNGGGFLTASILCFVEAFFASITGAANWGGIKYQASMNACISTHGGGSSYLPGSVAGSTSSGGQYV